MKGAILLPLLLVLCSAEMAALGLGTNCDTKSSFVTTNFFVNPYPPTAGAIMNVTMSGSFSKTQYVADIAIATSFNGGSYTDRYIDYSQNCIYGQVYSFIFPITAGTGNGLYTVQVKLEQKSKSAVSCWQYTYHIGN